MKKLLLIPFFLSGLLLSAQNRVRFVVQQPDAQNDTIYIAGTFNKWNPGEENHRLTKENRGQQVITLNLPSGRYEYKFTRGNWTNVESTEAGLDVANRISIINSDTTIAVAIEGWLDQLKDIARLPDSTKWQVAYNRSFFYLERNLDSSYKYAQLANELARKLEDKKYTAAMARILGRVMQRQGNHQRALEYYLKQLDLVKELKDTISISFCLLDIGHLFLGIKDYTKAKSYYSKVLRFDPNVAYSYGHSAPNLALVRIGKIFYQTHQLDSARYFALQAYHLAVKILDRRSQSESLTLLGDILAHEGKTASAIKQYHLAVELGELYNNSTLIAENYQHMARAYYLNQQLDSAFYYARKAFTLATELNNPFTLSDASNLLVTLYKNKGNIDSAFKYLEMVVSAKDSLFNQDKNQQLQNILFNEQLQKQDMEVAQQKFNTRLKMYAMGAGIVLLLSLCILLWLNNRREQRINALLNKRGQKIQKTLAELRNTQAQLIHKEKMASLGELTAGVAHEIQNPLNFINNFSEVSVELAREMKEEVNKLDAPPAIKTNVNTIANDLLQNQHKIREHGYRADAIVKGMLQHSRKTSGQREPVNINALADEFLRLSYHGLRAKDKSFNANFKTDFDEKLGKVTVVPQNMGRVLLNLFNNAFYSVAEKKKRLNGNFEPTVWVSTKKLNNKIEICVRDNGMGISQKILNKIFQPFYTTKPSGHGTGLGLSLSYDIITKEHGGTLNVETEEGEYAQFTVLLPATAES